MVKWQPILAVHCIYALKFHCDRVAYYAKFDFWFLLIFNDALRGLCNFLTNHFTDDMTLQMLDHDATRLFQRVNIKLTLA